MNPHRFTLLTNRGRRTVTIGSTADAWFARAKAIRDVTRAGYVVYACEVAS